MIELRVNDRSHRVDALPERPLLSVLRDDLNLIGTKYGCGEGQCGSCTVLVDGSSTRACITALGDCAGRNVTTVEGLAPRGSLHPVQEAFLSEDALQCAFCTSGMIMSTVALLQENAEPSTDQIKRSLQGNICRCGTYRRIIRAVHRAADAMKEVSR
jgi:aerobic-type carbon monoxide dehydrogenase small subunit (CoxS/CutS family)